MKNFLRSMIILQLAFSSIAASALDFEVSGRLHTYGRGGHATTMGHYRIDLNHEVPEKGKAILYYGWKVVKSINKPGSGTLTETEDWQEKGMTQMQSPKQGVWRGEILNQELFETGRPYGLKTLQFNIVVYDANNKLVKRFPDSSAWGHYEFQSNHGHFTHSDSTLGESKIFRPLQSKFVTTIDNHGK